jgi:23S rRNA pseudouridine1911/1915/1917 synthase
MSKRRILGQLQIAEGMAGQKIIDLLRNQLSLSNRQIRKIIATHGIRLNGRVVHSERKVRVGDTIFIDLPDKEQVKVEPVLMDLKVIYEDQWLLSLNKQAGIAVHNTRQGESPSLVNGVVHYFKARGETLTPRPIHRLDREASGIVLFAKDAQTQTRLTEVWNTDQVKKRYWALAEGRVEEAGVVQSMIRGRDAVTFYEPVKLYKGFTELAVEIKTGRTHQIRLHLLDSGHPLVGDRKYNHSSGIRAPRLALHAEVLEIIHPVTRDKLRLVVQAPREEFEHLIRSHS